MLMPYTERAQSPLYIYPMTPPLALPLSSAPAPLHGPLIAPPYRSHDGQLWFPRAPPAYIGDPSYGQPPPHQPESDNPALYWLRSSSGLPISGTPDHVHISISVPAATDDRSRYTLSHHLRATSRARSISLPPVPSQSLPPTQVEVEVLAPKPMPSPKLLRDARRRPACAELRDGGDWRLELERREARGDDSAHARQ